MEYTSWGNRGKAGDTRIVHLFEKSDGDIATFPQINTGEATVGEATWQLTSTPNTLTAVLPEGVTYTATVPAKKFSRAKEITIDFGDKQVQAINEGGADWVYVDATDNKLGQFSGSNNRCAPVNHRIRTRRRPHPRRTSVPIVGDPHHAGIPACGHHHDRHHEPAAHDSRGAVRPHHITFR